MFFKIFKKIFLNFNLQLLEANIKIQLIFCILNQYCNTLKNSIIGSISFSVCKLELSTIISSSVVPFSSCLQYFPASGSFPMSLFLALCGQNFGASASASVLPNSIRGLFSLGLTDSFRIGSCPCPGTKEIAIIQGWDDCRQF